MALSTSRLASFSLVVLFFSPLIFAQSCPSGQFRDKSICKLCPAGTYRNKKQSKECVSCPPGTFQPFLGALGDEYCRNCPEDTFSSAEGATSPSNCLPCPDGFKAYRGSFKCVRCGPGLEPTRDGCGKCDEGYYSDTTGTEECIRCPGVLTSNRGAKSINECRRCTSREKREDNCEECNRIGEILSSPEEGCKPCKQGFIPGIRGKFHDPFGDEPQSRCRSCPKDFVPAGSSVDGTFYCGRCRKNTGTEGRGASFCKVKGSKGCPVGFARKKNGDCLRCKAGEVFNKDMNMCVQCAEGEVGLGGDSTTCIKCPKGLMPSQDRGECRCPLGEFMVDNMQCRKCPAGSAGYDEFFNIPCPMCGDGYFSSQPGAASCQRCPFGSVPNKRFGSTRCVQCPQGFMPDLGRFFGFFTSRPPTFCVLVKTGCKPGFERVERESGELDYCRPIICKPGTPAAEVGKSCVGCEPGDRFLPNGKCARCPRNSVSNGGLVRRCTQCPRRLVRDPNDRSKCNCVAKQYMRSGLVDGDCRPCPSGTEADNRGNSNRPRDGTCVKCPKGTFTSRAGRLCESCPPGTFQDEEGASACKTCPPGLIPASPMRAAECVTIEKP